MSSPILIPDLDGWYLLRKTIHKETLSTTSSNSLSTVRSLANCEVKKNRFPT